MSEQNSTFSSIRSRFIFLGISAGIAMLCMVLLLQYSMGRISTLENSYALVMTLERDLLLLRRNEKDFLSRIDLKYRDKFSDNYQKLIANKILLHDALMAVDIESASMGRVDDYLNKYDQYFQQLVAAYTKLGLDHNSGLQGALRGAAHDAESGIEVLGDSELMSQMLMLRRYEKDFLLRSDLKYQQRFEKGMAQLMVSDVLPEEVRASLHQYQQGFTAMVAGYKAVGLSPKDGVLGDLRSASHQVEGELKVMSEEAESLIDAETTRSQMMVSLFSLLFSFLLVGSVILIAKKVMVRVTALNNRMHDIAQGEGDLTIELEVSGQDELSEVSRNFNHFLGKLREEFSQLSSIAQNLNLAASTSSEIAEQTKEGATRQHSETEQVSAAVNEMSASIQNVSSNIRDTADVAGKAAKISDEGYLVVQQTVQSIQTLAEEVKGAADETQKLEHESNNIGSVLDVIRGIAEQTNLLALNAAIEAARAGESGRGFAVVADEVRALSQKTQQSTEDIQVLIEALQRGVKEVVDKINCGLNNADQSVAQVQQASEALEQIQSNVAQISNMSIEIAGAAQQQETVADEINRSVHAISSDAEQTLKSANDNSDTASNLLSLAKDITAQVSRYRY